MLQFSQNFLQHEIREDFYIDSTMKTVWAATLDLLQTIAEVCERYGLEWYAAYGTLLGAIRHEGFIPWDDDVDIWMKRKDYQRMLEILPGELPQGYHVLSPQTEEGYEQFHTCVVCGEGISIEPGYLARHYGCPFRVGVDIFPLDYLPRDEELRKRQKNIFLLAKRTAQTMQEYRSLPQTAQKERETHLREIREGLHFLEEHVNMKVDWRLLEQDQWDKAVSAVYHMANEAIRQCPERDADDLVMYRDYANWERKVFPKEWFDEVWGATFENVMLPIPWKYDEVLQRIYGDYQVRYRGGTSHDYPYYEKQLEELRELVRQRGQTMSGVSEGKCSFLAGDSSSCWKKLFMKTDGTKKKVLLYANDISEFIKYGETSLDKLETVLQTFYEAREQILLWWRPCRQMADALGLVSESLRERYSTILQRYKAAGWGICDEGGDTRQAMLISDAYYGAENSLADRIRGMGKPVMIGSRR